MTTLETIAPEAASSTLEFPRRPRRRWSARANVLVLVAVGVAAVSAVISLQINPATFIAGYDNALNFLSRTVPLRFPDLGDLGSMVGQTLSIVVLATLLGLVISVPVAFLAAHNTTPHPVVRVITRVYIVAQRATPEFMIAMFFVRSFGIGALPGILGLGLGSVGMTAKLLTDAIEEQDPGPREALRAAGAGPFQQIVGAVVPALRPSMVSTTLYAFDVNLRASVLLGFVGVGGIGLYISSYLETMNYRSGLGLTLVLLLLCLVAELVSARVRILLLGRAQPKSPARGLLRRRLPASAATSSATSPVAIPRPARTSPTGLDAVRPPLAGRVRRLGWGGVLLVILVASLFGSKVSVHEVGDGMRKLGQTIDLYFPPSFGGVRHELLVAMGQTLQMGLAGTLLGLVIAIPFGLLSARNVAPAPWVATAFRVIVVAIRSIPAIIVGICFVVITGLGATAGALSLAVASIGFFGKIIADSLEETDVRVQEALRASGAGGGQVFFSATLRQVAPALASHTMHQLDTCIRGATGLGIIGAGGIGFYISNASRVLQYGVVTTCTLMVIVAVIAVEGLALWTRRSLR